MRLVKEVFSFSARSTTMGDQGGSSVLLCFGQGGLKSLGLVYSTAVSEGSEAFKEIIQVPGENSRKGMNNALEERPEGFACVVG